MYYTKLDKIQLVNSYNLIYYEKNIRLNVMNNFKYPLYKPLLNGNELNYVKECFEEGWISSKGKFVDKFELEFSKYFKVKHSISCSNGTTALHLALLSLGISTGDEVIVPSLTYVASANSIKYCGATPVFIDSEKNSYQLDLDLIESSITENTKAVLIVHLYSGSCDIEKLVEICKKNNLFLIEDCAESIGARYNDKLLGTFGDVACFSFYGNKTLTTGEGGMVVTNSDKLNEKLRLYRGQGLDIEAKDYYSHTVIGYNYRMTNICAAIGLAQLENFDKTIKRKREIAQIYYDELKDLKEIKFQVIPESLFSTQWLVSITCQNNRQRDELIKVLKNNNIETRPFFIPMTNLEIYSEHVSNTPIADEISRCGLNLPSYPELTRIDIENITSIIKYFFK